MGECDECGVGILPLCLEKYEPTMTISYKCIGYEVVGRTNEGKEKKIPKVDWKKTIPIDLIEYLKPKLQFFIVHNYIVSLQQFQFKAYLFDIPLRTIISCVDFSNNYTMKVQDEIQSMH